MLNSLKSLKSKQDFKTKQAGRGKINQMRKPVTDLNVQEEKQKNQLAVDQNQTIPDPDKNHMHKVTATDSCDHAVSTPSASTLIQTRPHQRQRLELMRIYHVKMTGQNWQRGCSQKRLAKTDKKRLQRESGRNQQGNGERVTGPSTLLGGKH